MTDYLIAFAVGGLLCAIAQVLIDKTALTPARILVLYVVSGVFLGGAGIYSHIVNVAGNGATTPLTGFGYLISEGVKKAIDEDGAIGILTGPLTSAAAGISAALIFGLIASLVFKGHRK